MCVRFGTVLPLDTVTRILQSKSPFNGKPIDPADYDEDDNIPLKVCKRQTDIFDDVEIGDEFY